MIRSARVERFRCFKSAELDDCRRVNVVVGRNGSGKTALLEALFMAVSPNPEIPNRLRQWRGYTLSFSGPILEIEDALWRDLFYGLDTASPVSISLRGDANHTRDLTISSGLESSLRLSESPSQESKAGIQMREEVTFDWRGPERIELGKASPKWVGQALDFEWQVPPGRTEIETYFFSANRTYSSAETAQRFSILSRGDKHHDVISLFNSLFPEIGDLSIEIYAGVPMVSARIPGANEKRAINLISGGLNKIASILLAIPSSPGCVVLVDEIESGFHHSIMADIWKCLLAFCEQYDAQIFATTHSQECLEAAADIASENEEEFSIIKAKDGEIQQYSGKLFSDAVTSGVEIR